MRDAMGRRGGSALPPKPGRVARRKTLSCGRLLRVAIPAVLAASVAVCFAPAAWAGCKAVSSRLGETRVGRWAGEEDIFADLDLDLDAEEDDWSGSASLSSGAAAVGDNKPRTIDEELKARGFTDEDKGIMQHLWEYKTKGENPPPALVQRALEIQGRIQLDPGVEQMEQVIESYEAMRGGGTPEWCEIPLNDTWQVKVAQNFAAATRIMEALKNDNLTDEKARHEAYYDASNVWPASIILSRWLAIHPKPPVQLKHKVLVEIGAGLGLTSLVSLLLGAQQVLLQDRDPAALEWAMKSAVENEFASQIVTLRSDFTSLADKLIDTEEDALKPYASPDIILGADILYDEERSEDVAALLSKMLRTPEQIAYIADPDRTRKQRPYFTRLCKEAGLSVKESEIVTWEPEGEQRSARMNRADWAMMLLTVQRP